MRLVVKLRAGQSHRQDDQELFSNIEPANIEDFNSLLEEYYLWRNENRRFKKLGWITPNSYLAKEKDEESETVIKLVA